MVEKGLSEEKYDEGLKKKIGIGIVGCGTIGSAIAHYCAEKLPDSVQLTCLFDIDNDKARILAKSFSISVMIARNLDELIKASTLVVEAASAAISADILERSIDAGRDVMIMSVGGIVGREGLLKRARKNDCRVYIPSGAVCGLDGIKAAALKKIDSLTLTTRKPPKGLKGAPYIEREGIDLDSLKEETVIFEGTAKEAVKAFPKNVNVSAVLSLAGIGAEKTRIRVICSPGSDKNIHEIEVKAESGDLFMRMENLPSPGNPKTSYLAALSAMATLKGIVDTVRIGT